MEKKAFLSPRKYDCGHWSTNLYYYEDNKTGKSVCTDCYKKEQLEKASNINQGMSKAFFGK